MKVLCVVFFLLKVHALLGQQPRLVLPVGHTYNIKTIQFNTKATKILTASSDRSVKIWDVRSGLLLHSLEAHTGYVNTACFSPDENYILTASNDGTAILWETKTGTIIHVLKGHENLVLSAAFSQDGKKIITASWDFTAKIWDTQNGELLHTLKGHTAFLTLASFSPDGNKAITSAEDNRVKVWNTESGQLVYTATDQSAVVKSATFSPDGKMLLTAGESGTAKILEAETGKLLHTLKDKYSGSTKAIFSPDGKLVACSVYEIAYLWEVNSGQLLHKYNGHKGKIKSIFFSSDGEKIITSSEDSTTRLWSTATGKLVFSLPVNSSLIEISAISNEGKFIATGSNDGQVNVYKTATGSLQASLRGHSTFVNTAKLSRDGKHIFTASNKLIQKWSAVDGKMLSGFAVKDPIQKLVISKRDNFLVTTYYNQFQIWDQRFGKLLYSLQQDNEIKAIAFSDDDEHMVICSYKEIGVWKPSSGQKLHTFKGEFFFVYNADFSPDGKYFVAACGDSTARVWDAVSGKLVHSLKTHKGIVLNAVFSNDGKFIITRCYDNVVRIWDAVTGMLIHSLHHNSTLEDMQISLSGRYMISASTDSIIRFWDIALGQLIDTFKAGNRFANYVAISADEKYLVVDADNNISEEQSTVTFLHLKDKKFKRSFQTDKNSFFSDLDLGRFQLLRTKGSRAQLYGLKGNEKKYEFIGLGKTDYIGLIEEGYYQCSPNAAKLLHYVTKDLKIITFEQLDVKYNRPDKVLEAIGNTDTALIKSYRKAWEKRIKKLGIDTTAFRDGYSVPEADFTNRDAIEYEQKSGTLKLLIKGNDSTYKLDRFNVWVNETPIFGQRGINIRKRNKNDFDTTISIKLSQGENRIETSITNENGTESYRMPLLINYTPAVKQKESVRFIGIGIDQFTDNKYNLQYSAKDIRDLSVKLKEKYKDDIIIDTLFNENVTTSNVKALKQKLLQTTENDKVIIAYSGHGMLSKEYDYYLSTYSVNFDKPEQNGLPYDELESLLDSIPARKKLMLIDACHSGEVDKEDLITLNASSDSLIKGLKPVAYKKEGHLGLKNSFELMQSLFVNVGKSTGATIISAAAGTQFALERNDLKNGVFTYSILEAMNKYPTMKISELKKTVGERVEQITKGLQKPTSRNETIAVDWDIW